MANVMFNGVQRIDDLTAWITPSVPVEWRNGWPIGDAASGYIATASEGTVDHWQNGLPCDAAGSVVTTANAAADQHNGFSFDSAARLCINYTADPNDWTMRGGFMFDSAGALKAAGS